VTDDTVFYSLGDVALQGHGKTGVFGRGSFAGVHGVPASKGTGVQNAVGVLGVQGRGKLAGKFLGDVAVTGDLRFEIQPNTAKSPLKFHYAANLGGYFEHFGTGQLAGGTQDILFDANFKAVVDITRFLVFLTPTQDCKGLYYTPKKDGSGNLIGFTVNELQGAKTSTATYVYRIVAPRPGV
jgi:hypothetical protein